MKEVMSEAEKLYRPYPGEPRSGKLDLQCDYCGEVEVRIAHPWFRTVRCSACGVKLFVQWASGVRGEFRDDGFYFKAHQKYVPRYLRSEPT